MPSTTRRVACQIRVAYEAGPCGFGWYDRLQADGLEVLVVAPSLIPVESGNKVKTELLLYAIRAPFAPRQHWTGPYLRWLKELCWEDACPQVCVEVLLRLYAELTVQVKALERRIKALAATAPYKERVRLLRTLPGIGLLTAMKLLAELPDMNRFASPQHLASSLGLTLSEYSSGPRVRQGRTHEPSL